MNNEPAFPTQGQLPGYGNSKPYQMPNGQWEWCETQSGMTLRDYFAAKAMQGLIMKWSLENGSFRFEDPEGVSAMSYKFADAMLVERDR